MYKKLNPKNKQEIKEALLKSKPDEYGDCYPLYIVESKGDFRPDVWHYWIDNGDVHSFGHGQGWEDQSSDLVDCENIDMYLSMLWKERKNLHTIEY